MNPESAVSVTLGYDPVWPWSLRPPWGLVAFAVLALILVAGSVITYTSALRAGRLRAGFLVFLRFLALLLALLVALRPALGFREEQKLPSTLLVLVDSSESMTVKDEAGGRSRWDELRRLLREADPIINSLRDSQNLNVIVRRFDRDLADFDPAGTANGKQSAYGPSLKALHERHHAEPGIRAVLVIGDGADNGLGTPALTEAGQWKAKSVPVHTFILGSRTTSADQNDLNVSNLTAPGSVPIKNALAVRITVDALGYVGSRVKPKVFLTDEKPGVPPFPEADRKEVTELFRDLDLRQPLEPIRLERETGNEILLYIRAPERPGPVKLTFRLDSQLGEVSSLNNEASTFVTITKEGLRVLLIDNARFEMTSIGDALRQDKRVQLDRRIIQTGGVDADSFRFDKNAYDAVMIGDISPTSFTDNGVKFAAEIRRMVSDRGVGLLMYGGARSLGGDGTAGPGWGGVADMAALLPVELVAGEIRAENGIAMLPTEKGLRHFVMRLGGNDEESKALWAKLPRLVGINKLGKPKTGAEELAFGRERLDDAAGPSLLVWQQFGKGRTMAFAGDTTLNWYGLNFPAMDGVDFHAKFWRKVAVFLAQQENASGNVSIRLDSPRLSAGTRQEVTLALRGRDGAELADPSFDATITGPDKIVQTVPVTKEKDGTRRVSFWKSDAAGDYRVEVVGRGKEPDGTALESRGRAYFLVHQNDTEILRPAADPEFMTKLAREGGGQAYQGNDLPRYLRELETQGEPLNQVKVTQWPEWRRGPLSVVMPLLLLLFGALLLTEWVCRRAWGLA